MPMKRIPKELMQIVEKIQKEAEKKGYTITEAEAMRIIAKSYKSK